MQDRASLLPGTDSGPSKALTEAISQHLLLMATVMANPKPHSALLVKAWALALHGAGIEARELSSITQQVMAKEKFFPSPAVFIEIARPKRDAQVEAEAAWLAVLGAVRKVGSYGSLTAADVGNDPAALWVVKQIGWGRLCEELGDETRSFYRAEFIRFYAVATKGQRGVDHLPGLLEIENAGVHGRDLDPALVGRPDWKKLPGGTAVEEYRRMDAGEIKQLAALVGAVIGEE